MRLEALALGALQMSSIIIIILNTYSLSYGNNGKAETFTDCFLYTLIHVHLYFYMWPARDFWFKDRNFHRTLFQPITRNV